MNSLHTSKSRRALPLLLPSFLLLTFPSCASKDVPEIPGRIFQLNGRNFEKAIKEADRPMVVLFGIPQEPFTKINRRALAHLSIDWENSIDCGFVNTYTERDLENTCAIREFPTIVLYENGKEVDRVTGRKFLSEIKDWLTPLLKSPPKSANKS